MTGSVVAANSILAACTPPPEEPASGVPSPTDVGTAAEATATLDKPTVTPGQTTKLSINAVNFFGPPAANRNYETEVSVSPKYFSPKKPEFEF